MALSNDKKIFICIIAGLVFIAPTWWANQIQDEDLYSLVWYSSVGMAISVVPLMGWWLAENKALKILCLSLFFWKLTNLIGLYFEFNNIMTAWMMHVKIGGVAVIVLYYLYERWRENVSTD